MSRRCDCQVPRHLGILTMPDGDQFYGPSYVSPDQITGKEEVTTRGFSQEVWMDDGSCVAPATPRAVVFAAWNGGGLLVVLPN